MKVREQVLYVLSLTGYTATIQDIQRAYWRMAKQRGGIAGSYFTTGYAIAEYLIKQSKVQKLEIKNKVSGLILVGI